MWHLHLEDTCYPDLGQEGLVSMAKALMSQEGQLTYIHPHPSSSSDLGSLYRPIFPLPLTTTLPVLLNCL